MANIRVKDLPNTSAPAADTDEFIIDSNSAGTRRLNYGELKTAISGDFQSGTTTYKVATLGSDNKLDPDQIPDTLSQGLNFVGVANSAGDLTSTTQGDFYVIQTAFGVYSVGDQAVYDGSAYVRVTDGTKEISEGGTGATTLDAAKVNLEIIDIGTAPNQCPTMGMLGSMSVQDADSVSMAKAEIESTTGTATTQALTVTDGTDTNFVVQEDGKVGIGGNPNTTNPLRVSSSDATTPQALIQSNTSTGDAALSFNVSGRTFSLGIDKSDSEKFKISRSSALGTTDYLTIDGGEVTIPGGIVHIGAADTASAHLNAYENMTFNIDSDNDDTNRYFGWYHNGNSGSGNEVMRLEEGNLGIGCSPVEIIHAKAADPTIRLQDTSAGGSAEIEALNGSLILGSDIAGQVGNSIIAFKVDGSERWRINSSGNLVANSTGIDFGSGSTLDAYEEGSWTPTDASGAGLSFTVAAGNYIKVGSKVTCWATVRYPTTSDTSTTKIGGLPEAVKASTIDRVGGAVSYTDLGSALTLLGRTENSDVELWNLSGTNITNATMSGKHVFYTFTYDVS